MISLKRLRAQLFLAATAVLLPVSAHAQNTPAEQAKLEGLQEAVDSLAAQVADLKRQNADKYAELNNYNINSAKLTLPGGRPTFTSGDGAFTAALRVLVQADSAYYGQSGNLGGADLSSGTNFRRARLALEGKLFSDWSYNFTGELGGSGTENPGTISQASIQYDGATPFYARFGIFAPSSSLEDSTPTSDLIFLERSQPTDLGRTLAAADGRVAASIFNYTNNYYWSVSYTGGSVGDALVFDEQQAVVGYGAYRLYTDADSNLVLGASGTYIFKIADAAAGPATTRPFRFRERPELNIDGTRLIDTGNINSDSVWQWGLEAAGNYQSLYAQGGYFNYGLERQQPSALSNPHFDGWYAQASWVLTGEAKQYRPERGAFQAPRPAQPFSLSQGTIGAWELAARYSVLNLNHNAGVVGFATPVGGVRGGKEKIWTVGLNWYPNNALRFQLDYQHSDIERLNGAGANIGGKVDAVSLRAQLSL